ncbi:hypothetical protein TNCV_3435241 [Trichonephila clavipes]|nr:hypothetical protein TNCV_3435241 [Trichonephila clavipes]
MFNFFLKGVGKRGSRVVMLEDQSSHICLVRKLEAGNASLIVVLITSTEFRSLVVMVTNSRMTRRGLEFLVKIYRVEKAVAH